MIESSYMNCKYHKVFGGSTNVLFLLQISSFKSLRYVWKWLPLRGYGYYEEAE